MIGYLLAFCSAISQAIESGIQKAVTREADEYATTWGMAAATIPFLLAAALIQGIPELTSTFWMTLAARAVTDTIGLVLYLRAIKISDLSLSMPFISFTPAFLLILGPLLLGEHITLLGIIGVLVTVIGTFVLTAEHGEYHRPFTAVFHKRGPRIMLGVGLIWACSNVLHKIGITASNPTTWALSGSIAIALLLTPFALRRWHDIQEHASGMLKIGVFTSAAALTQFSAIQYLPVAYVSAIKRLAVVMSVLIGISVYHEKHWLQRIGGCSVMVIGAVLITLN